MKKKTNNSGITLIALIITIIVMLILVAVTVNTAVNSGLFGHAKNATQGWADKEAEESNIGNDNYIKDTVNEYSGKVDRSFLKVGDYVSYTPTTESNYKYTGLGTSTTATENLSGSASNSTDGIPQDTTLAWRILSINDDGSVDIVSAKPTNKDIYFNGSIGFNNGVYLLNDLCAELYSNSTLGVTARSMNLIDIENKLNVDGIKARDDYKSSADIQYGHLKTYEGSSANVPDIYERTGTSLAERTKPYYTAPTTVTHTQKDSVDIDQTFYKFGSTATAGYFDNSTFYELVFGTGSYYWLASRYANCYADYAGFGLFYTSASINGYYLFYSNNDPYDLNLFVRPVVTLGSDIQISVEGGTADAPRTLSK